MLIAAIAAVVLPTYPQLHGIPSSTGPFLDLHGTLLHFPVQNLDEVRQELARPDGSIKLEVVHRPATDAQCRAHTDRTLYARCLRGYTQTVRIDRDGTQYLEAERPYPADP